MLRDWDYSALTTYAPIWIMAVSEMAERILTQEKVEEIVRDCLFRPEEIENRQPKDKDLMVVGEGLIRNFGYHKDRLEKHREEIITLLKELPDNFFKNKGGGWSFLNACNDRHGNLWGQHIDMESLFTLGIAIGVVQWQMKDMMSALPGGVPYVVVNIEE